LIYAWNENDEGGWLVPTLNPDGSANSERLTAMAAKLKNKTGNTHSPGQDSQPTRSNQKP
jgi:hypothetical protein